MFIKSTLNEAGMVACSPSLQETEVADHDEFQTSLGYSLSQKQNKTKQNTNQNRSGGSIKKTLARRTGLEDHST